MLDNFRKLNLAESPEITMRFETFVLVLMVHTYMLYLLNL